MSNTIIVRYFLIVGYGCFRFRLVWPSLKPSLKGSILVVGMALQILAYGLRSQAEQLGSLAPVPAGFIHCFLHQPVPRLLEVDLQIETLLRFGHRVKGIAANDVRKVEVLTAKNLPRRKLSRIRYYALKFPNVSRPGVLH